MINKALKEHVEKGELTHRGVTYRLVPDRNSYRLLPKLPPLVAPVVKATMPEVKPESANSAAD